MTKKEVIKLDKYYMAKYGITWAQREAMMKAQGGACAICKKSEKMFKRRLSVDHDHLNGKVRGLLCFRCNKFLVGKHNLETARLVHEYLKKAA